jgi:DHA1 family bicyclomycin/chloramphenicol resistance-like MFS transporter
VTRPYPSRLPLLLGFLQAVGPVSTDMYLPAFQVIDADLHAHAGAAQLTLATWILGLAFGQLLQGTLADRFGRRVPLLLGTAVYTLASAGCACAPSIAWLAIWRFVAALGGSASMIVPRAVVRDVTEGHDAARMMSRLILILGVAPILAPSLGGLVLRFASWRDIFWIMTAYGGIGLLLTALYLPDTLAPGRRMTLHVATMLARYGHILTERNFITHVLMLSAASFALFAYLSGSPTVFITYYHLAPSVYAVLFGAAACAYILFSQLNVFVTRRLGLDRTLHVASSLYLAAALTVLAFCSWWHVNPYVLAAMIALTQGLNGFIMPTGTVGALTGHAAHAGSASAVMGTLQFLIGSSSGFLLAWLTDGTPVPMLTDGTPVPMPTDGTPVPMAALMVAGACTMKLADLCRPRNFRVAAAHPSGRAVP